MQDPHHTGCSPQACAHEPCGTNPTWANTTYLVQIMVTGMFARKDFDHRACPRCVQLVRDTDKQGTRALIGKQHPPEYCTSSNQRCAVIRLYISSHEGPYLYGQLIYVFNRGDGNVAGVAFSKKPLLRLPRKHENQAKRIVMYIMYPYVLTESTDACYGRGHILSPNYFELAGANVIYYGVA